MKKMKQDLFTYLPSKIIVNILSRLSVRTIATSKCVCKSWFHLLETDDFVKSHLAKSSPALAVVMGVCCKLFELEDELDLDLKSEDDSDLDSDFEDEDEVDSDFEDEDEVDGDSELEDDDFEGDSDFEDKLRATDVERRYNPITKFNFSNASTIQGSANGLLLLKDPFGDHLYVCNPIIREFVDIGCPHPRGVWYGFGVSKTSGQHKAVCVYPKKSECHVYTLETGSWRSVEVTFPFDECYSTYGAFVNGNLHWLVSSDSNGGWILCFDVETECFSTFDEPGLLGAGNLFTLGDRLCFCDESSGDEIVFWLIEEYEEDEKCWSREYDMMQDPDYCADVYERVQPIKVYRNGDILGLCDERVFVYYANNRRTIREITPFGAVGNFCSLSSIILTPSFLSLKSLGMKNESSF